MAKPRPDGLDKPVVPKIIKWMSRANVFVYRVTFGLLWSKWRVGSAFPWGVPICLLTTMGRKSGKRRTTPLLYIEEGDSVVLVASKGGLPKNPAWLYNVKASPDVDLQIRWRKRKMRAQVADEGERAELWPKLVAHYADFADYQSWTERTIPVVVLRPR